MNSQGIRDEHTLGYVEVSFRGPQLRFLRPQLRPDFGHVSLIVTLPSLRSV